jgi:hypothetical protein
VASATSGGCDEFHSGSARNSTPLIVSFRHTCTYACEQTAGRQSDVNDWINLTHN